MATEEAPVATTPLFAQVKFYIIEGHGLSGDYAEKIASDLQDNGGTHKYAEDSQGNVPLNEITHIVSSTTDFPLYEKAINALIPVVKPAWVESSIMKRRLANPRQYSPDPKLFFSGLVVCCADLPVGDEDAILGGVLAMGGLYSGVVTKMVTHIVALTTDPEKCRVAQSKKLNCMIVLPHWFDDCFKLGKRIDEGPYLLPNPEILRLRPKDHIPEAGRRDLQGASSTQPGRLPTPLGSPSASRRALRVFRNKKVMLSDDLQISSHLRSTIEDLIVGSGGHMTGIVRKADMYMCQYRDSQDYRIASRAGKDVGNLAWLYHLITHNTWTSPTRRLLHYPVSRQGLPGFKDFRISLSNYNGEARIYLENLAKAAGGEFTRTMKQDNTHLITAHLVSEKCDAAKEWNINIVNHLWLEESYAKWQIQTLANPRYSHFPPRTNLGEVVGQTQIDKKAVERHFFPEGSDIEEEHTDDQAHKQVQHKEQNIMSATVLNSSALKQPISAKSLDVGHCGILYADGPTPRAKPSDRIRNEMLTLRTPATSRPETNAQDNGTPSTTGSRGAKDRAVAKLHDLAPDIALYEKEKKRVGGVIFGGRRLSDSERPNGTRKRSVSTDEDSGTASQGETREPKRVRKNKATTSMRLLLSGYRRWVAQPRREADERSRLKELGIQMTSDPASCTHVAAPKIVRTQKFACALAYGPMVLSTDFVDLCLAKNEKLPPEDFLMNDHEGESRLGFKVVDATKRAKNNKNQLLRGYSVYCTEHIFGGFDTFKNIIQTNGGKCSLYRARSGSIISTRIGSGDSAYESGDIAKDRYSYLISGTTSEEGRLGAKFRQAVRESGRIPRVVKADWLLDQALTQKIYWDPSWELGDNSIASGA